jgi:hypothetical protein
MDAEARVLRRVPAAEFAVGTRVDWMMREVDLEERRRSALKLASLFPIAAD